MYPAEAPEKDPHDPWRIDWPFVDCMEGLDTAVRGNFQLLGYRIFRGIVRYCDGFHIRHKTGVDLQAHACPMDTKSAGCNGRMIRYIPIRNRGFCRETFAVLWKHGVSAGLPLAPVGKSQRGLNLCVCLQLEWHLGWLHSFL